MTVDPSLYPARPPGVTVGGTAGRGWGPGWPDCPRAEQVTIRRDDGLRLPVHRAVAELVTMLLAETERRGYDVEPGHTGGFVCRPIRRPEGSTAPQRPSNHSWGLAVDINWRRNPHRDRLVTDMPPWMPTLWWDHLFFWGGWYRARPDAMHYEFLGTPEDAVTVTERARVVMGAGLDVQAEDTAQDRPGSRTLARGSDGADVSALQHALGFVGDDVDGLFGRETQEAVRQFQRERGLVDDGIVGPMTWAEILRE